MAARPRDEAGPPDKSRPQRLQKILAEAGVASRRAAEALITEGRVSVNGRTARLGDSAVPSRDTVALDGTELRAERLEYWLVHKPRGVLTTASDPHGRRTVLDLVPESAARLFPVGRLDRDTEGLVLLTNDGALAHHLLHPSFGGEREYRVTVRGRVPAAKLRRLAEGILLDDVLTAPARVGAARYDPASETTRFALTLIEGRKRQIRRALTALGHPVTRLLRVRMGTLRLGRLEIGSARRLDAREQRLLRASTEAPSGGRK